MGGGIAQLAAMKGLDVILCDMHSAALERSIATTNRSLSRLVGKQQLTQDQADSAASRIRRATDMQVSSNSFPPSTAVLHSNYIPHSAQLSLHGTCKLSTISLSQLCS
jgi:3-hydroxyacyl-CoA dehydrogenase